MDWLVCPWLVVFGCRACVRELGEAVQIRQFCAAGELFVRGAYYLYHAPFPVRGGARTR